MKKFSHEPFDNRWLGASTWQKPEMWCGTRLARVRGYLPLYRRTLTLEVTNCALTFFGLSLELQVPSVMMM